MSLDVRWSAVDLARALGRPDPTEEQQAVIEAPLRPLLVVAGAGSGKTETMAARVVWLVANGLVEPDAVLALTFTRKAAGELAARIRARLRALRGRSIGPAGDTATSPSVLPTVATYHAYAGGLVSEYGPRLGLEPDTRVLGQAGVWQLATELVEAWDGPMDDVAGRAVSTVVAGVVDLAAECAEHLVDPSTVDRYLAQLLHQVERLPRDTPGRAPARPTSEVIKALDALRARRQLLPLLTQFTDRKRAAGLVDFADQVSLAAQLAALDEVAAAERSRHRVVLLDEYQDTSHAQLVLLSRLYGAGHPVTAVGDPQQAIYGWRGASAGALDQFTRTFAPVQVAHLATSWRNDRSILHAANTISAPLRARSAGSFAVPDLRPRPDAGTGQVRLGWYDTVEEEAAAIADELAAVWQADESTAADGQARRTVAVLCRKRQQIPRLEQALRARGLPVEVVGVGGLLATPEVADLVATLRVVHDPARGDALMRLLSGPHCRLGPRDLHRLGRWARHLAADRRDQIQAASPAAGRVNGEDGRGQLGGELGGEDVEQASLVDALDALLNPQQAAVAARELSPVGLARAQQLARRLRQARRAAVAGLPELVDAVVRIMGLDVDADVRAGLGSPGQASTGRGHLNAFADLVATFVDRTPGASLGGLLAWLSAAQEQERGFEPGQVQVTDRAVQLMTVHAAKGLEWDVVAVPGLSEGVFPAQSDSNRGWLVGLGRLPYPLRGDKDDLPEWHWEAATTQRELDQALEQFRADVADHEQAEERRIAYVALTRARSLLIMTGHQWADARRPRTLAPFLAQVHALTSPSAEASSCLQVLTWAPPPPAQASNPRLAAPGRAVWPVDPLGPARPDWEAGAALVRAVMATPTPAGAARRPAAEPGPVDQLIAGWRADVDALLAERAATRRPVLDVPLPARLSVSALSRLPVDPETLAADIRRPVPAPPRRSAQRGTGFHTWLESQFSHAVLVDLCELPGAADDSAPADDHDRAALDQMIRVFRASEWAERVPVAVEVPFELPIGPIVLAGRADAVFATPDGGYEVVDWKTGRPPDGRARLAQHVQLACYRLAWSRQQGVDLAKVSAALFYASTGQTVRPVDLLDEPGLLALIEQLPPGSVTPPVE